MQQRARPTRGLGGENFQNFQRCKKTGKKTPERKFKMGLGDGGEKKEKISQREGKSPES